MENRRCALVVTVLVSTASYFLLIWEPIDRIKMFWLWEFDSYLYSFGFNQAGWNFEAVSLASRLWILPFALRLGPLRSAAWIALIGVGSGIYPLLWYFDRANDIDPEKYLAIDGWVAAFTGLAMIGRRTRPWMAVPAGASFSVFAYTVAERLGDTWGGSVILHVATMCSYAAILIFGTSLIPKKLAKPATPD